MRSKSTKQPNSLGLHFRKANRPKQLQFIAALYEATELDGSDYYRAFRDNWQYSESVGRAPFVIVQAAIDHLDYSAIRPDTTSSMLSTLKMQQAA